MKLVTLARTTSQHNNNDDNYDNYDDDSNRQTYFDITQNI